MKLYDRVKQILEIYPLTRDSDKHLIWEVWSRKGFIVNGAISKWDFLVATSPESITRARRKVQEDHPELRGKTYQKRKEIADKYKGMDVYHRNEQGTLI